MTAHLPADRAPDHRSVSLRSIAEIAAVAAEFLRLAARTGLEIEMLTRNDDYDELAHAVQSAADAARHAATPMVDITRRTSAGQQTLRRFRP